MRKVLVPIDGSANSGLAIKHIIRMQQQNESMEVHLLNVQQPLNRQASRFVDGNVLSDYHQEQSTEALKQAIADLKSANIACIEHAMVGDSAETIVAFAKEHQCDLILMGSGRKNSFIRFMENSVTNQVLEMSDVPVEVIPGQPATMLERLGLPAGVGVGLTLLFLATE